MVPGHEIIGQISKIGSGVTRWSAGDTVGVGCFTDACGNCAPCLEGEEQFCEKGPSFTYNSVEQDKKTPTYGGYSAQITVDEKYLLKIPKGLPLDKAAPLLCAGITTYSPMKRFGVKAGQEVAVVGLGGLGHMAVKIAKAMGARVTVLSHSPKKREDALSLGADDFIVMEKTSGPKEESFHFMIDTVSARHDYNAYLKLLKRDCTMVLVGIPGPTPIDASVLVMRRRHLAGSLIGGIRETQEMLEFCALHKITADIELVTPDKINEAYERTIKSDVKYRFVIDLRGLKRPA
jgi:uncharacterized zinc-type alcohol dehydrogenase-like protein